MEPLNIPDSSVRYCLYARKSSEGDERQAMSIDSQIKEMSDMAARLGIHIKEIRRESHSAKISGKRPVFIQMIEDIRNNIFDGILTWAPDRLSRNAGDLGLLVDLMDQNKLVKIQTYSQSFTNNPNEKFLLMILCSQAKLENDQKGLNVKRGIKTKCEMGWRPAMAPIGYYNRAFNGIKDAVIDPNRGELVKKMFLLVAEESYSGQDLWEWCQQSGLTNKSGKRITLSQIYLMLRNPYYYGEFEYPANSGKWYKGKHQPLISKEIFDQVQKKLVFYPRSKWGEKNFIYKGLFKCASCGASIVGEDKLKKLTNGQTNYHVYYHCSRQVDYKCEEPYINEEVLVLKLIKFFQNLDQDKLNLSERLKIDLENFTRTKREILSLSSVYPEEVVDDLSEYARYVLREGSITDKRNLITGLNLNIYIHNQEPTFKKF
ncbi:MAG: recombinase family protein [Candidatus Shapirobacteria bacterium]